MSGALEILNRDHELLNGAHEIHNRGPHEILCRDHEINKTAQKSPLYHRMFSTVHYIEYILNCPNGIFQTERCTCTLASLSLNQI
jgi:hypothetical protein